MTDLPHARDLDAVLRPLEEARNLPGVLYGSPRVFEIEREEIFASMWVCVGRGDDVREIGDYFTATVAGRPVLVARSAADCVEAFLNVCRHRGSCIVDDEAGQVRSFRCPYHGWTYGLDGALVAAPLMQENPGFDAASDGLHSVRARQWNGFLFVCLDDDGPGWDEAHADLPDLSAYGLGDMALGHRAVYDVAANWKVICENYSECYHCALVHPQLNRVTDYRSGGASVAGDCYNGGPMELNEGCDTISLSGVRTLPAIESVPVADRRLVHYYTVYPTFLIGLASDYAIVHRLDPVDAAVTRVVCDWLFPRSTLDAPGFDAADILRFWDVTNRQDWRLCERVQRGARSGLPGGAYHPLEACVHAFDSWYVGRVRDALVTQRT